MIFKGLVFHEVKKLGSSKYFVSCDEKYFLKRCKDKKRVEHEFRTLKKYWKFPEILNFRAIRPILYDSICGWLMSEYIEADTLIDQPEKINYQLFGIKLRLFHDLGYTHGHLQFNDVIYNNGEFILTDFEEFNKWAYKWDLALLKLSIKVFQLKRPWLWKKYAECWDMFCYGYGAEHIDYHHQYRELIDELEARGNIKVKIANKLRLL